MTNYKEKLTLHDCVEHGDLDKVTRLLDDGCPVDGLNRFGETPLCTGADSGHTEIVKVLISHGADVNVKVKDIQLRRPTPLHCSARSGHTEIVNLLIQHGADFNVKDSCGETPLHCSARSGHTEIVNLLIQHGADFNVKDNCGETPLHYSAWSGHTEIVNLLIQHGADFNVKDKNGKTPLHYSARSGHTEIVNLLIQHGADIDPVNRYGNTPLMLAESHGHRDTVKILRQAKPIQAGDDTLQKFLGIFSGIYSVYSLSTRKLSIQSSDGRGRITKVKYEDKEVRSHVTGAVSTSESATGREGKVDKVKVTTKKGSQGHKKQELVTKSAEASSYLTTSKVDICTSAGLSSTPGASEQPLASASSSPTPLPPSLQTTPPSSLTSSPQSQTPAPPIRQQPSPQTPPPSSLTSSPQPRTPAPPPSPQTPPPSPQTPPPSSLTSLSQPRTPAPRPSLQTPPPSSLTSSPQPRTPASRPSPKTPPPPSSLTSSPQSRTPASRPSPKTPPPSSLTSSPQPRTPRPSPRQQPSPLVQSPQRPPPTPSSIISPPPTTPPPPPPQPRDEVTEYAQKLLKAVKGQRKSDQDPLNVPSEQLDASVIVVKQKTVNNHYHNTYHNHCHTCQCNNKQKTSEEVLEKSETLNVSVGSARYSPLHPPQGDDYEDRGTECKRRDRQTSYVDMMGEAYTDLRASTFRESTSSRTTTTSTLSSSSAPISTPAATGTSVAELRRRLESQAGYMEKMVQSCVAGGGVCQDQSSDLVPLHHGAYVPVNFNFIMQPKHVEVWSARQMNVEKAEVENAEMMPVNSTCNFNYAAKKSSDDEDNDDNTDDDNSEDDKEIQIEHDEKIEDNIDNDNS